MIPPVEKNPLKTLLRHGHVTTPSGTAMANVLIANGKIIDVAASPDAACDQTIDCTGKHILPGVVDDQVHFREPGLTHKEDLAHASRACAAGGVTSFLEMPNTIPNATTVAGIHEKQRLASASSIVNYGFYIGATPQNIDDLIEADDDPTIPGIKIFIGSSTGDLLVDDQAALERIFALTKKRITAHCEDESTVRENAARLDQTNDVHDHSRIRDHKAARIATARAIDLANRHKHPFHVLHVSTADEVPLIAAAKDYVTAEVCLHHLFFNIDDYDRLGTKIQMNPSIKTAEDNAALWQALISNKITVIATDHAPHTLEEKSKPYPQSPSGLPAVENSLALMLGQVNDGRITIDQVAAWMSTNPAAIWKIKGKGQIAEGFDADLVIVDLTQQRTIHDKDQYTKSRWSPWHGETLTGWPVQTLIGGQTIWSATDGFTGNRGSKLYFGDA